MPKPDSHLRRFAFLAAISSLALASSAAAVDAHTDKYPVHVSKVQREPIEGGGYVYSGSLSSANRGCVSKRSIAVLVLRSENVRTDGSGNWLLESSFGGPLEVVVAVRKKLLPRDGEPDKQFCKKGRSSTTFTDTG
jgi:hypothetical protein